MHKRISLLCLLLSLLISLPSYSAESRENVILLMLDGVRWQEVFHGTDPVLDGGQREPMIFQNLFHELSSRGVIFGDRTSRSDMEVSNSIMISLPAYQSIMAGYTQSCLTNICGRIGVETIQERVLRELKLSKNQVATIASWNQIRYSAEHIEGSTLVNTGTTPFDDGTNDPEIARLNAEEKVDRPSWGSSRYDKYTFSFAMHHLKKHQPRFMFISLNDSDEWAHRNEYKKYVTTLHQYDNWIESLFRTLDQMGEYGRSTTVLITTDHGRGDGSSWTSHGFFYSASKYIWLFGRMSRSKDKGTYLAEKYSHIDIRPTIEANLGLSPLQCTKCGKPIRELSP